MSLLENKLVRAVLSVVGVIGLAIVIVVSEFEARRNSR